jgi:hypothetical protein
MALVSIKPKSMPKKAKNARRSTPNEAIMPVSIDITGTFCLPNEQDWSNPIMPEGFITYTDLMPSSGY